MSTARPKNDWSSQCFISESPSGIPFPLLAGDMPFTLALSRDLPVSTSGGLLCLILSQENYRRCNSPLETRDVSCMSMTMVPQGLFKVLRERQLSTLSIFLANSERQIWPDCQREINCDKIGARFHTLKSVHREEGLKLHRTRSSCCAAPSFLAVTTG
jgi:hypothetical protein